MIALGTGIGPEEGATKATTLRHACMQLDFDMVPPLLLTGS
jgi:hypothetical protein